MDLTVLSFDQNYVKWVKPFSFFLKIFCNIGKRLHKSNHMIVPSKKIKRLFNRNIHETALSFDNKTFFERKHIILNPFFIRMIKNLVKDNTRVLWSKIIKDIKKTRAIKSNKFFLSKWSSFPWRSDPTNIVFWVYQILRCWEVIKKFAKNILKRHYGLNCIIFWSNYSEKAILIELQYCLIK